MAREHLFIQLLILLQISTTVISGSENQISQSPAAACVGKNVTVMCTLNVPERADIFISPATNFIYGDYIIPSLIFPNISNCSGLSKNNSNFSSNIISYLSNVSNLLENISNISSYNISTPVGNSSRVFGAITLNSYTTTDKSLQLGCINYFYDNGSCSVVESVIEILYLEQAEPPSLVNCTVNNSDLDPYTCNFRYGFSWTSFTGKVNGESFHYSLLASTSVLYSINSAGDFFNYSDATSLMPGNNVNFTLRTENCAGVFSAQCFEDVFPIYEIVNGSINVVFSLQTSIFTVSWNLKRNPPNSSDHLILLKYKINIQVDYKYNEQNSTYTQTTGDLERDYLSNVTSTTETFMFDQAGTTLGRIDLLLNVQIVQQCGHNISGDLFTDFFNFSEPPTGFNCTVENSNIDPYTCSLPYRFTWTSPTNKLDMDSLGYTLLINNVDVYAITSRRDYFNFSDNTIIMPGQGVNFSLTAQNFAGVASQQCFTDVIPFYEIVNGSINVVFSLQTSIFTVSWNLKRNPPNSSDHLILLKYKINIQVDYKYNEQNSAYTQTTRDLERNFLSNVTSTTETFMFDQAGTTLGRIDLLLNIQIIEQCGHDINGDKFNTLFKFSEPPTGFNCTVENSNIDPYTCSLPYRFAWTSPTNKLDMDSLGYTLLINNVVVVYAITSMRDYFNFSDNTIIMPGQGVNFSLTAQNFAGVASQQCFTDVIPYYEFVSGSINLTFSLQTNIFTVYWKLKKNPPKASDHLISLKYQINIQVDYKYNERNGSFIQTTGDLEMNFLSNVTSTTDTFMFDQAGTTLGRIDLLLDIQIIEQCGYDISGDKFNTLFKFSDPPTGFNCSVMNTIIDPYTCRLPTRITWTSPTNRLDREPLQYFLFSNKAVLYSVNSTRNYFNFSDDGLFRPGERTNLTLSVENFAGVSYTQCYSEVLPSYEFLNGSINVTFSSLTNNFTFYWELRKEPPTASDRVIELTIQVQLLIVYKFIGEDILRTENIGIERKYLSNVMSTNESVFPGLMILDKVDLSFSVQIVQQCGFNISGDVFNSVFNYTSPIVCKNNSCFNDTDMDGYPNQLSICPHLNKTSCIDNCPFVSNPNQTDCDGNGIGDVCDTTCETEIDNVFSLNWVCNKGGAEVRVSCPDRVNSATRKCLQSGDWSDIVNTSQCVSLAFANITNASAVENLDNALEAILTAAPVYSGDVTAIVDVLESTLNFTVMSNDSGLIVNKTLQVVDILVNANNQQLLNQTQMDSGIAQQILGVLDRQARILVKRNIDLRLDNSPNVFFETKQVDSDVLISADNIKDMGQLPPTVNIPIINNGNTKMSVSVLVVRNIANLFSSFSNTISFGSGGLKLSSFSEIEIVTPIVSVQIFSDDQLITSNGDDTLVDLNFPLDLSQIDESQNYIQPTCLFLANAKSNNPQWQDEGIGDVSMNDVNSDNVLTCSSGHTTAFVVLIGINSFEEKSIVLNVYTYFGCVVAISCLLISIAIYLLFGRMLLKKIHHFMHFQLAISLCLLYLVFLLGVEFAYANVWHYIPCKMVTVLIEYFLLVVFLWMFFESVVAFIKILWPFFNFTWKPTAFFFCMAWLLPIFYVIPFIPFFHEFYLSPPDVNTSLGVKYCWLYPGENAHTLYTIIAPLALLVLANSIILTIAIICIVALTLKQKTKLERGRKSGLRLLSLILVLFVVIGSGWAFGFLAIYFNHVIYASLFAILCCFQGLLFLIFVLLLRRDIQRSIGNLFDLHSKVTAIQSKISARKASDPFRDNIFTEEPKILPETNSDWDPNLNISLERDDWRSEVRELEASINRYHSSMHSAESGKARSLYQTPRASKFDSTSETISLLSIYEDRPRESALENVGEESSDDLFTKIRKDLDDIMTQVTDVEL